MEKRFINYNITYGNLKRNRKMFAKNAILRTNIKGNIIGILSKHHKRLNIVFKQDKLFSSIE